MSVEIELTQPEWPTPTKVKSLLTNRVGGFSKNGFSSFNLATHVGDDIESVQKNRELLANYLPSQPIWLNQVHGIEVFNAVELLNSDVVPTADAIVTNKSKQVLAIMTADCVPILFTSKNGSVVGAAHAGWRGLCGGVIENTVEKINVLLDSMKLSNEKEGIAVWLGPSIGPKRFEVGREVFDSFIRADAHKGDVSSCFTSLGVSGKYLADLHALAKIRLSYLGINKVYEDSRCCFEDERHYFSYRRESVTGRFASLIWIE